MWCTLSHNTGPSQTVRMRSPGLSVYLSGVTERVGEPELGAALAKFGLEEALAVQELAHKTLA